MSNNRKNKALAPEDHTTLYKQPGIRWNNDWRGGFARRGIWSKCHREPLGHHDKAFQVAHLRVQPILRTSWDINLWIIARWKDTRAQSIDIRSSRCESHFRTTFSVARRQFYMRFRTAVSLFLSGSVLLHESRVSIGNWLAGLLPVRFPSS